MAYVIMEPFSSGSVLKVSTKGTKFSQKKAVFTVKSAFLAAMTLNGRNFFWESYFVTKKMDFSNSRYQSVICSNLVHAH